LSLPRAPTMKDNDRDMADTIEDATRGIWRATMIIRLLPDLPDEFRAPLLDLARRKVNEAYEALPTVIADLERFV
jgi:hypothetical protein